MAVPNVFINGDEIEADDVNENFTAIDTVLNTTGVPLLQDGVVTKANMVAAQRLPSGMIVDYAGATAPTGWLLCYGQAISRETYADLFTAISTAHGSGDGSTTFNVPDLRGRVTAGLDNMGGSDAGRLDVTNTLGGVLGAQDAAISVNELPTHTHSVSGTAASDGAHTHTVSGTASTAAGSFLATGASSVYQGGTEDPRTGATYATASVTGTAASGGAHTHTVTGTASTISGHTGQTNLSKMQPTMLVNKIIKT